MFKILFPLVFAVFIFPSLFASQTLPLPPLPYSESALEPFYSTAQLTLHHSKHLQTYTDNLNNALNKLRDRGGASLDLANKGIFYILQHLDEVPQDLRTALRNNGGGYVNHAFFFSCLAPNPAAQQWKPGQDLNSVAAPLPMGESAELLTATFGSYSSFVSSFTSSALSVFGSGWTWLLIDSSGKLLIQNTPNQDVPSSTQPDLFSLLVIDVWEHAYYKDYENRRADYLKLMWKIINWRHVEFRYQQWKQRSSAPSANLLKNAKDQQQNVLSPK